MNPRTTSWTGSIRPGICGPTHASGCQAVIKGDVVAEFPLYTRNYVQEGGGIQLGKPERQDEIANAEVRS